MCAIELTHALTVSVFRIDIVWLDTDAYSQNFYELILAATLSTKNEPVGGCWTYDASKIITYTVQWALCTKGTIAVIGC